MLLATCHSGGSANMGSLSSGFQLHQFQSSPSLVVKRSVAHWYMRDAGSQPCPNVAMDNEEMQIKIWYNMISCHSWHIFNVFQCTWMSCSLLLRHTVDHLQRVSHWWTWDDPLRCACSAGPQLYSQASFGHIFFLASLHWRQAHVAMSELDRVSIEEWKISVHVLCLIRICWYGLHYGQFCCCGTRSTLKNGATKASSVSRLQTNWDNWVSARKS